MNYDYHFHSHYSNDADFSCKELCEMAKNVGCRSIALTDHNCVMGIDEMIMEGKKWGIDVVPGVEIDCVHQGVNFHLLAYHMDYKDPRYQMIHDYYLQKEQEVSNKQYHLLENHLHIMLDENDMEKLKKNGILVPEDIGEYIIKSHQFDQEEWLRPYLAGGDRSDNPFVNFYWDYFSQGKPAYVAMEYLTFTEILKIIEDTNGIAIVAHPGNNFKNHEEVLLDIFRLGAKGMEVYSSYHTEAQTQHYNELADQLKLKKTVGSDFHGKNKPSIQLGIHRFYPSEDKLLLL